MTEKQTTRTHRTQCSPPQEDYKRSRKRGKQRFLLLWPKKRVASFGIKDAETGEKRSETAATEAVAETVTRDADLNDPWR
jgi:hypothetical protein